MGREGERGREMSGGDGGMDGKKGRRGVGEGEGTGERLRGEREGEKRGREERKERGERRGTSQKGAKGYDRICLYMLVYVFGNICIRCICMYIIVYVRTYSRMIAHACELLRFF